MKSLKSHVYRKWAHLKSYFLLFSLKLETLHASVESAARTLSSTSIKNLSI